ncbi:MAG: valine--tRNA ligase [archaeon]
MTKPKGYDVKEVEEKWKNYWEKEKIYKFDPKTKKKIYSIDTPPPTVSGKMHIGHAFSYSQQDFIVRFHRMFTGNVFYPFGTDDNGLPTERLVEKLNNVKSKEISRSKFIEICLKTLKKITPDFIQQWKDLGISADYETYYSTIDKNSQKLSQKSFIELYKNKQVYREKFPTIWCPECQTSIAQAELEDREFNSVFSTLKFECEGKDLLIATTRPELLDACVAIFVHPDDKRYKSFIGKKAEIPLFGFQVPVVADKSAEIKKGTGAMMVCSYGDKYDVDAVKRYKLKPRIIFNKDGTIKKGEYGGLRIKQARKKILEDLKKSNLIKEQKEISHSVNVHDKCGTPIEFIPTEQWFIKILDKKKKLIEQGRRINWYPKFMHKRYENWIGGLEWDWNISRDRHFGVSIPVWYCEHCKEIILAKESELPIDPIQVKKQCPKCKAVAVPEEKVLDTWATSSLTPQITSSLIKDKIIIPYSLRPQAHDIIRTWAFYTIVKSYLHEKKIPWNDVMISGFAKLEGQKMSKSKGIVVDPQKAIDQYGADALRFWAAGSKLGEDLDYQEKDLITGKKFVTKLLNASRFVFMNLEDYKNQKPKKLEKLDEKFLIELSRVIYLVTSYFKTYEYSRAKFNAEEFFLKFFCDYYLEAIKKRVYQGRGQERFSAQYTLYKSLLAIIKLIAPIMPFITEEIYQTYFKKFEKDKSIHLSEWPKSDFVKKIRKWDDKSIKSHANELTLINDLISKVRTEKTKAQKPMNAEIILTIEKVNYEDLKEILEDLKNVTNAKEIREGKFDVEFL